MFCCQKLMEVTERPLARVQQVAVVRGLTAVAENSRVPITPLSLPSWDYAIVTVFSYR